MIKVLYILPLLALAACTRNNGDCDVNTTCYTSRPDSGYVNLNVTDQGTNGHVPVTIYEGDVEDNKVMVQDTLYGASGAYYLPVSKRYSARAVYVKGGITTFVYDGDKVKVLKFWNCDEKCFDVEEANMDLKLK